MWIIIGSIDDWDIVMLCYIVAYFIMFYCILSAMLCQRVYYTLWLCYIVGDIKRYVMLYCR